ncbi:benign gonial cell neoplasm protein isoform X1 [Drosophila eugracilis]|uniref:benign gonial cell neoplasm protein isoform X1 n=1 Tax=Drosophila eugracilis TaxID=29029 RepID=UPI0007E5E4F3|nr:benign gonial cell neoplasm protein isoform X1 [Drosophila eugracilis]
MNKIIQDKFIPQQLVYFIAGRRCCQLFPCTFRTSEHEAFCNCARSLGLRSQIVHMNGNISVKIYKQGCRHYLEEPKMLTLSSGATLNMFTLLGRKSFMGKNDLELTADVSSLKADTSDLPSLHLPLPAIRPPNPFFWTESQRNILATFPGYRLRDTILWPMYANRVIVFNAELSWDKSFFLPLLILNDCQNKKTNAKIICIEMQGIVATYNSQRMANFFGEELGETVGVQLPHFSAVSSNTYVIFSTAQYFLRSLAKQKFRNVSHLVVNDVHLHDPYTDLLLSEIRLGLCTHPNLRVVLLSQMGETKKFTDFFGEGAELNMIKQPESRSRISYLNDLHSCIALAGIHRGPHIYKEVPEAFRTQSQRNEQMDKCLQAYGEMGTDASIRPFLYAVNYDLVPVNYRHSLNGKTAVHFASELNKASHLRLLLFMGADPYIVDQYQQNAISLAAMNGNHECIDVLNNYSLHGYVVKSAKPDFVDYDLIIDIMYLLRTKPEYSRGNILIILPTFYHLVKLNYMILSHCLTGSLQECSIFLLHEHMRMDYLDALVGTDIADDTVKVVLATGIIESLPLKVPFKYEIDTACRVINIYDSSTYSGDDRYEWVGKDCLLRRELILNLNGGDAQCFRLINKEAYDELKDTSQPHLQTMQLDKICLAVKFLSPNMIISEYLGFTISPPPLVNVHHAVQFLKKIDVLEETEDVTWLGCRLTDLPVPCQLGRMLIFGILLRCLDPILTIVSSLLTADPLGIPFNEDVDHLWDRFTIYIQNRIKNERTRLADNQYSDHFIFVRLFQEWQNRLHNKITPPYLTDEYDFVLNGLMEQLSCTRAELVSSLRAANLIHSRGKLTMQNLNQMSGNWHMIKAALTGGLYPNICVVDAGKNCLKSAFSGNVNLHPNTVLRDFLEPLNISAQNFRTPWIVCTRQKNHIVHATMVVPLAVALFAGSPRLRLSQICDSQITSSDRNVNLFIDEWIWMVMSKPSAEMMMRTRQCFFKMYHELLKNCGNQEMWRHDSPPGSHYAVLTETLSKIFESEESCVGFSKPLPIIYLPSAQLPALYLLAVNSHFNWNRELEENLELTQKPEQFNSHFIERQFFILYSEYESEEFHSKTTAAFIESVLGKFSKPIESPNRHIFVILYRKDPYIMLSISRAKTINGVFTLKEYFRNSIPVYEILDACGSLNVTVPVFDGRLMSCLIDKRVGNLIMDLFAFRHHWIHQR